MVENVDSIQINFDVNSLWLVNITLAIIMFGVALDITVSDFKALFNKPKKVFVGILLQFFLVPAITLLLVYVIQPQASLALGLMIVAACPGGNVSNFMTKIAKGNTALSVSLTAFATAMALFITPINLAIWANLYEPTAQILKKISLDPLEVTKIVLLILGIPLLIGMYIRHKYPNFAVKLSKIIKP
ncbi:MAG TPA: bile acid:sodium symporter family protein, partial [Flavobacteriaceae bacterium]|nr:bile acid:sodium symporter family protein [Flavobacteriaceae bacterium]